ncbi:ArsC family reductase [Glaciecola sp. 1036]|uniref:ArsC family reductase n=1 Tax=Alteromonadaceae TaxID=72275 RepID=UPI003D05D50B
MTIMYGIPNCDTVKKARKWLTEHNIEYRFHDYKKQEVDTKVLMQAISAFGSDTVVNKRGTTYRQLDDQVKANINDKSAIEILTKHPSMIKRPILVHNDTLLIGFKVEEYEQVFTGA